MASSVSIVKTLMSFYGVASLRSFDILLHAGEVDYVKAWGND